MLFLTIQIIIFGGFTPLAYMCIFANWTSSTYILMQMQW
jgi:hypothetical protein